MYELLILGGGPAGYNAAERAAGTGLSTLLFEERALGGVCLNEGCVPSKTLLYSAKLYDYAKGGAAKYGVACDNPRIDYGAVVDRKDRVVKTLAAGVAAKLKAAGVTTVRARAVLAGRTSGGFAVQAGGETYEGRRLLLCAGSEALIPPIEGLKAALDAGFALTSREILGLREIPESLVVVGGGVIGLEMASLFRSLGSRVTVVELLGKIAGPADAEVSAQLQKDLEKRGVVFRLEARVTAFETGAVRFERAGVAARAEADRVLVSIGRRAVTAGLGLETLGVAVERGAVLTDEQMKTNLPGVFAAGDINGKSMLAHTAYREGEVAVNVMAGGRDRMSYRDVPYAIYTSPEAAGVGETLDTARRKGLPVRELRLPMRFSGRYIAENEGGNGLCKLVVGDGERLLGAHLLGGPASEIIPAAALALSRELDVNALRRTIFPHPSVAEILRECAFSGS
jgi:dihydrolipoamide dehydrogenase